MKTLEERKKQFKLLVWDKIGRNFNKYPEEIVKEFVEHWTTVNDNGNKMYFEMKSITKGKWSTLGRLATFVRNRKRWDEIRKKQNGEKMPDYFQKKYWQRVQGKQLIEYKQHLTNLGYQYVASPGGTFWQKPDGERIWL